jgi:cell division protein YceG involved in septum cleavage
LARGDRSSGEGGRSPEERERDRLERERRRAERGGAPPLPQQPQAAPVPPLAGEEPQTPPAQPAAEELPVPAVPGPPLADPVLVPEPVPPAAPEPVHEPEPQDTRVDEDPELRGEPAHEVPHEEIAAPVLGHPADPDPDPDPGPAGALPAEAPFLAPGSAEPVRKVRGGGRSAAARIFAVIALLAVIAAVVLVAKSLRSSTAKTAPAPVVVKVVIPEGKTRAQIALLAKAAGLSGSYRLATRHSPILSPEHYGAPKGTPDLEGFLFPASYELNAGAPASRLAEEQLVAFKENFGTTELARARSLHVTPYELLIVASMVEREAAVPADRAKIAAVIYNRLKEGTPLGIDASIYYAVELRNNVATYTGELTEADLHMNSPYNTRTHTGLPPTPISNPGDASIHAAAYPAQVPYLYYVAGADGCGEQVFSTTAAAFEENVAKYKAAVAKNGGHPPTCRK